MKPQARQIKPDKSSKPTQSSSNPSKTSTSKTTPLNGAPSSNGVVRTRPGDREEHREKHGPLPSSQEAPPKAAATQSDNARSDNAHPGPTHSGSPLSDIISEADIQHIQRAQRERVLAYQLQCLKDPNLLMANLGSLNGELMHHTQTLGNYLTQAMGNLPPNIENLKKILPAVDTHLRMVRQIDRLANFELRVTEARERRRSGKH